MKFMIVDMQTFLHRNKRNWTYRRLEPHLSFTLQTLCGAVPKQGVDNLNLLYGFHTLWEERNSSPSQTLGLEILEMYVWSQWT